MWLKLARELCMRMMICPAVSITREQIKKGIALHSLHNFICQAVGCEDRSLSTLGRFGSIST
jgi:hypothetical protein